jgi:CheY-like chemotaxis protein
MASTLTPANHPPVSLPEPILVIDDDAFVCTVVAAALTAAGAKVSCCTSGDEALAAVATLKPALVLLDFVMPRQDGRGVWKALCECYAEMRLPPPIGVFLTARHDDDTRALRAEPGIAGIIAKPFDPMTFVDQLRALLRTQPGTAGDVSATRLAAVAEEFMRSLPAAADHIGALAQELRAQGWQRATAEALLARAHSLAGTAGLFNRHALGMAAGETEGLLLNYLKRAQAPDHDEMARLDSSARALLAHCRGG